MNAFAGIRPKGGQNPTPLAFFPGVCSGGYLFSSGGPTPTTPPPIFTLLPCVGTVDRQFIYDAVFCNVLSWIDNYPDHMLNLGGDLNVDIDKICPVSTLVNKIRL